MTQNSTCPKIKLPNHVSKDDEKLQLPCRIPDSVFIHRNNLFKVQSFSVDDNPNQINNKYYC